MVSGEQSGSYSKTGLNPGANACKLVNLYSLEIPIFFKLDINAYHAELLNGLNIRYMWAKDYTFSK